MGANYRLRFSATTWDKKTPMVYISTLEAQEQAQHLTRIVGAQSLPSTWAQHSSTWLPLVLLCLQAPQYLLGGPGIYPSAPPKAHMPCGGLSG